MTPLVDTLKQLRYLIAHLDDETLQSEYPAMAEFLNNNRLEDNVCLEELKFLYQFLYVYGRKSEATFNRFRNEIERFHLWSWLIQEKSVFELKREDIESYVDFVVEPDKTWLADSVQWRFKNHQGTRQVNPNWRPFVYKENGVSQQTLASMFTALNVFYKFAILEEKAFANFVPVVKKNCPYLVVQSQIKLPDTLSDLQWEYVFGVTKDLCEQNPKLERNLFTLACLKGLYLRISELSERPQWSPVMSHFWQDQDGFWFLRIMGKGNKLRDVTLSDDFVLYLKRYRQSRGLTSLPRVDEPHPIIHKLRGQGGMNVRQLRRIVQESFDLAIDKLKQDGFSEESENLEAATSHWLRHTGATHDAQTRPLKHLSEDLGHSKIATTDQIYIQTNVKERAKSGVKRKL
ncbi:tyrosine-type recombinase/integrase [Pseudoalteromonas luteoviolacea]|uniref:Integrase n=1 Tax=Pseudoalteromonas luteoviolacea S4054 TaxID=1129367 RepID=A0A0F6AFR2_9GAMM|nr:tyrosine-type recombinase/integrase [Pseudoalteromonas luteoviolacea]AOT08283.1 integrase [Pseudoalteromonas luteoviolacea]AOT13199.1 integrase [Pseudoalteromonas luteoviolacea]AOT18112.1 integrase [Pseudoalteromonas luteoviolacea]KKE84219.1 integrase [Pseudoalteromonas luteoviolacea S4054]KZN76176.1 integrase [Pseudoalteromonas luteoviolacea S4047-1]